MLNWVLSKSAIRSLYLVAVFVFGIFSIIGSASRPQLTRDEWIKTTTRVYKDVTKEQVVLAAEKLLILADGDDFVFAHSEDGFFASRNWSVYLVLAFVAGTDHWMFKTVEHEGSVKAQVQISVAAQGVAPMQTTSGAWAATTMPGMSGMPVTGPALYDLFWARMDYLLGAKEYWMLCENINTSIRKKTTWGNVEPLCLDVTVKDNLPENAKIMREPDKTFVSSGGNVVQSKPGPKESTELISNPIKASPIIPSPKETAVTVANPIETTAITPSQKETSVSVPTKPGPKESTELISNPIKASPIIPSPKETAVPITNPIETTAITPGQKETGVSVPKTREKLAVFPITANDRRSVKPATISALSKELLRVSYLETTLSYYDLGENIKAKRIPSDIINETTEGSFYTETQPNISEISKLGEKLGVDYVCGARIKYLGSVDSAIRVSIYLVDVHRKRLVKEDYDLPVYSAYNSVGTVVRKFFDEFNYTYIAWKSGN
jgi:hypothetical protein